MDFIKEFFLLNFNQFDNFGISFPIGIFLTSMAIALCAAVFIINHHKRYTCSFLKQLLRHEALDDQKAKTLTSLKLENMLGLKSALARKGQLTYMVKRVGETEKTYDEYMVESKKRGYKDEKIDFESALFYIAPERVDRAKRLVETTNTEWWRPALMAVFIVSIWVIMALFVPELLQSLNEAAAH